MPSERTGFSEELRYEYPLRPSSIVFDVGAHRGTFAAGITARYGCRVVAFEPVRAFYEETRALLLPRVDVLNVGLAASDRTETITVRGDGSSILVDGSGEEREEIELWSVEHALDRLRVQHVDLLKLNVEGSEFEILEQLLDRGLLDRFEHIQVQFHRLVPDAEARRAAIVERLVHTHPAGYSFPFVWESYSRGPAAGVLGLAAVTRGHRTEFEEWITYHRLAGVERFWLYDNSAPEIRRTVVEPLAEEGDIEVIDWPLADRGALISRQIEACQDACRRAWGRVSWLALIDLDEFLLPRLHATVPEALADRFDGFDAVYVNWRNFGTGGVRSLHHQPVLNRLLGASDRLHARNAVGKSIVRPEAIRLDEWWSPHHAPLVEGGRYADGDGGELELAHAEPRLDGRNHDTFLRLNHYGLGDETAFRTVRLPITSEEPLLWEHYREFSSVTDAEIGDYLRERHPAAYRRLWERPAAEWPPAGPFVAARVYGRLGNNLFQVATASALAWDNGAVPVFPDLAGRVDYESIFRRCDPGPDGIDWLEWQEPSYAYSPIPYRPNLHLVGYFQSERYFLPHRPRLQRLFAPPPEQEALLRERYGEMLARPRTVAVQLRYYRRELPDNGMYPQYGLEYLERAAAMFPRDSVFVVSSNDLDFAAANLPARMRDHVILDEDDDTLELHVLARCRDAIITNSSFGWWAAWLNATDRKLVVRPSIWVHGLPAGDVCPPGWVSIAAPEAEPFQSSASGVPSNQ